MDLVFLVIQLMHELHDIVFDQFTDPNLLWAAVVWMLGNDQSEVRSVLRELHGGVVDTIED